MFPAHEPHDNQYYDKLTLANGAYNIIMQTSETTSTEGTRHSSTQALNRSK